MYFVYTLKSLKDHSQYVGMSRKPEERLKSHNKGNVDSTKIKRPWNIVYKESCPSRIEARKREKYLESAAGRRFRKSLAI